MEVLCALWGRRPALLSRGTFSRAVKGRPCPLGAAHVDLRREPATPRHWLTGPLAGTCWRDGGRREGGRLAVA